MQAVPVDGFGDLEPLGRLESHDAGEGGLPLGLHGGGVAVDVAAEELAVDEQHLPVGGVERAEPQVAVRRELAEADVALELFAIAPQGTPDDISVLVEGRKVDHTVMRLWLRKRWLRFIASLSQQDYTVVTLHTPIMFRPSEITTSPNQRRLGVAVGNIILKPLH